MTRERSPTSVKVGQKGSRLNGTEIRYHSDESGVCVGPGGLMSKKLRQQHRDFIDRIQAGFSNPHFFDTTLCNPSVSEFYITGGNRGPNPYHCPNDGV